MIKNIFKFALLILFVFFYVQNLAFAKSSNSPYKILADNNGVYVIEIVENYNDNVATTDISKIKLTSEIPSDFSWYYLLYPLLLIGGAFLLISLLCILQPPLHISAIEHPSHFSGNA